jgi:hypothetical protein
MKRTLAWLVVCAAVATAGAGLSWVVVSQGYRARVAPFDRSVYKDLCIDPAFYEPFVTAVLHGTNRCYWVGAPAGKPPLNAEGLHRQLSHLASFSKETIRVSVSFNPEASLAEVEQVCSQILSIGFTEVRLLLEPDSSFHDDEGGRVFKELRFGPLRGIGRYQKEWYIDWQRDRKSNEASEVTARKLAEPQG